MSDVMLLGVLRMPLDIWPTTKDALGLGQIQSRCVQAADRIESDERKIAELEEEVKQLKIALVDSVKEEREACAMLANIHSETAHTMGNAEEFRSLEAAIRSR